MYGQPKVTCRLRGEPSTYSSQNTPPLTSVRKFSLRYYCLTILLSLDCQQADEVYVLHAESPNGVW
jgi:hypothetical protein